MDYKYIEQLLERYWKAETSLEEENILHAFFSQGQVPEHLAQYKFLFDFQKNRQNLHISENFANRIMQRVENIEEKPVVAKRIPLIVRLRPFLNAAAVVAVVMLVGMAAQHSFNGENTPSWDYNAQSYTDTYDTPEAALDETMNAFRIIGNGLRTAEAIDSLNNVDAETNIENDEANHH